MTYCFAILGQDRNRSVPDSILAVGDTLIHLTKAVIFRVY